jgi:hypothetical protein
MPKNLTNANDAVQWTDSSALRGRLDQFTCVEVSTAKVLGSWRYSLFAHEWLDENGHIKALYSMIERERLKRLMIMDMLEKREPLERPVLGLGLDDDIEIGAGRAVFLTLTAEGYKNLPVHCPLSCLEEMSDYLA